MLLHNTLLYRHLWVMFELDRFTHVFHYLSVRSWVYIFKVWDIWCSIGLSAPKLLHSWARMPEDIWMRSDWSCNDNSLALTWLCSVSLANALELTLSYDVAGRIHLTIISRSWRNSVVSRRSLQASRWCKMRIIIRDGSVTRVQTR